MKRNIILFVLLILYYFGHAQIVTVQDNENDQPVDLVTFISDNPKAFALTNPQGQAEITAFRGAKKIEVRLIGYQTLVLSYDDIERTAFLLKLNQTAINLDQVVVSATRWNQEQREVPARILVISPKDVALDNPQTTADLLESSGEVFIQKSQQGGGSPMIRGFATNRLLYTVDGIRMNTAIFRSGNLQNVISLDPFSFESAEVIFGPASLIYGSDAIAGVMSFQTLTPQYSLTGKTLVTGSAIARYASENREITGHFDVNVGWKKWAFLTSFSSNNYGDLRMGSNGPDDYLRPWYVRRIDSTDVIVTNDDPKVQDPTGYSQINLMQKISYKPSENWELQYGFHYSITSGYSRYDRLIQTKNGLPRSAEWYYGPQEWMMNNLTISNKRSNILYDRMTIRLAWQLFGESRHDRSYQKTTRYDRVEKVNAYSLNADFIRALGSKHTFFYGLELVWDDVKSTGTDEDIASGDVVTGPSRYPQSTWSSYAAYLSYQFKISEKALLQAGARYNYFMLNADFTNNLAFYPLPFSDVKVNDGALTGNLGFVYNPTAKWSLIANVSTGFRAPNVDDLGKVYDSEPGSVVVPNPGLEPEYAYNAELGVAKVFGDAVKVDLTAYYTYLQNAMVRRDFTLNGLDSIMYDGEMSKVQAIRNAAFATVYGIQAGLEVKLPVGFGFTSQFNYQKGEEELDDGTRSPLRHAAPWFGVSHLTFTAYKLQLDLSANYNGEISYRNLPEEERGKAYLYAKDEDGNPYSPAWYTLNLKALYQLTANLSVSAGVENLTDRRYRPYSSGIAGPGLNFILALRARF
jgi:hemoglobin/transferrin/lactoferrin receptor protein